MRRAALAALCALVSACSTGGQLATLQQDGYELSGGPREFRFTVELELLREWGGDASPIFKRRLELELYFKGFCPERYRLGQPGREGERYVVSGMCEEHAF